MALELPPLLVDDYERLRESQTPGFRLMVQQRDGVRSLVHNNFYGGLGFDVGTGKTDTAAAAAYVAWNMYDMQTVVVTTKSTVSQWEQVFSCIPGMPTLVTTWEQLHKIGFPKAGRKTLLIADEAHFAKNIDTNRTKSLMRFAQYCSGVFLLTGTPYKNGRPNELYPLLKVLRRYTGTYQEFLNHFALSWEMKRGTARIQQYTENPKTRDELRELVASSFIMVRKEDVLKELRPLKRILHSYVPSEEVQACEIDLVRLAAQNDRTPMFESRLLTARTFLRGFTSRQKCETTVRLIIKLAEKGESCVVYVAFHDTCNLLLEALGESARSITGKHSANSRQETLTWFRSEKNSPKVLIITDAAKEGVNLQSAKNIIVHDLPWVPGDLTQIEGRVHRKGQESQVVSYWVLGGMIDDMMHRVLLGKTKVINRTLNLEKVQDFCLAIDKELIMAYDSTRSIELLTESI